MITNMKKEHITLAQLGAHLKLIRHENGITLNEIAQALEMNPATLSKFENGGKVNAENLLDIICFYHEKYNLDALLKHGTVDDMNDENL